MSGAPRPAGTDGVPAVAPRPVAAEGLPAGTPTAAHDTLAVGSAADAGLAGLGSLSLATLSGIVPVAALEGIGGAAGYCDADGYCYPMAEQPAAGTGSSAG